MLKIQANSVCQNNLEECKKLAENINCSRCDVMRAERPVNPLPYKKKEKRYSKV